MTTAEACLVDGLLVAGFGVQHSILATARVKGRVHERFGIKPLPWRSVESLSNVVYILIAAALWQHVSDSAWHVTGPLEVVFWIVLAASWLWYWQLHLFEYDCGLAFGSTTLVERLADRTGVKLVPWKVGSRRWIRFPVHTAFFGMFFAIPHMTYDLLVLAVGLNVYNVIGSVLYDKRLEKSIGEPYVAYQRVTGLIWPPIYRAPHGASEMEMPEPRHWRRPAVHLPGLAMGVVIAGLYYVTLGDGQTGAVASLKAAGVGLLAAILVGAVLGRICRPEADSWSQQQTDVSTTVALAGALGVALWAGRRGSRTAVRRRSPCSCRCGSRCNTSDTCSPSWPTAANGAQSGQAPMTTARSCRRSRTRGFAPAGPRPSRRPRQVQDERGAGTSGAGAAFRPPLLARHGHDGGDRGDRSGLRATPRRRTTLLAADGRREVLPGCRDHPTGGSRRRRAAVARADERAAGADDP